MIPTVPEKDKKPGVCYAVTDDGVELPVIDITNPAFEIEVSQEELPAFAKASAAELRRWMYIPSAVRRFLARDSVLMEGTSDRPGAAFMSGMTTYLNKLGPANLGEAYIGRVDRRSAAAIPSVAVRYRLRAVAVLLADGLVPLLEARPEASLHLLDIAGGTAIDSLNALIVLGAERPDLLAGREIRIRVLDLDTEGPSFGARALAALTAEGRPLQGLDASLDHVAYDWTRPSDLRAIVQASAGGGAVVAGSSEGGLFEYGADDDILANLEILRDDTPDDFFMVGSIFRDEPVVKVMKRMSDMTFRPRDPDRFAFLIARAGWSVDRVVEGNPVYNVFRLGKLGERTG